MGEDQLALTSVGTGRADPALGVSTGLRTLAAAGGIRALSSLLEDCADLVETMMQWMSRTPAARHLDREMGSLEGCPRAARLASATTATTCTSSPAGSSRFVKPEQFGVA